MAFQIDLIDMRHLPDGCYKWIAHAVDHWSKFNFAYPLVRKTAEEVAEGLQCLIFPYFGLPSILQSDNGKEFVNAILNKLVSQWPGKVQLISGRPRHPQSQGLVEQAHHTLERMIAAKMQEDKKTKPPWSKWLPHIICMSFFNSFKSVDSVIIVFFSFVGFSQIPSIPKSMRRRRPPHMSWYLGNPLAQ